ncbi:Hypothetical_protein [Hexamita inflata]|uniref:Hypothetical_protein n=1 Tax=Hexamita inflata TaxID=28002 RepID=A0AA86NQY7_9EUKA|nr:Hypothetical protein HINF_LOCUS11584 [Hexamita inflata]
MKPIKAKSDFLTRNQDAISQWRPLPMTYSLKERNLTHCDIAPLGDQMRARISGYIWAYHFATSQQVINPYQEKFSGCFSVQKSKLKPPVADMDRITDSFRLQDYQSPNQSQPQQNIIQAQIFDHQGMEIKFQTIYNEFYEPSEEIQNFEEQTYLNLLLKRRFVRIVCRDQETNGLLTFKTPLRHNTPKIKERTKCPFSSLRRVQRFMTPNPYYSKTEFNFQGNFEGIYQQSPAYDMPVPLTAVIPTDVAKPPKLPRVK